MGVNVYPQDIFISYYDPAKGRQSWEQSNGMPGMSVKQMYLGQILAAIAMNPTTMLDPETHVGYAIKMVELAVAKTDHW